MDPILQSQSTECGLACLAMVNSHHGNHIGLRELRRRFPASTKGTSLGRLMEIGRELGMTSRALRLGLDGLTTLQTPCVLHWNLNHFVVLERVGARKATIIDPAAGRRVMPIAELSAHFTGVALELSPGVDFRPQPPLPAVGLRQLTGPIGGLRAALGMILGLSLALQVFVALSPFFMQWVVDHALVSADRDLLLVLALGFGLVMLFQVAIGLMRGWAVTHLSSRLNLQWTGNVFAHLLKLPLDFFEKRHLGDIVSRMGSVQAIQRTLSTSFVEALIDGLMAVVALAMMLLFSWKLAAVSLVAAAAYVAVRSSAYRPLRSGVEQQLVAAAKQQSHLLESIRGMQSLKVSGTAVLREAGYRGLMNHTVNREVWVARATLVFASTNQLVFGIERIVVIWLGAGLALSNALSVGMLIAYLAYREQFVQRVAALIDKWIEFRMLRLHGERLAEIVLAPPEADSGPSAEVPEPETCGIEVRGLSFRYAEGEREIVRECSFDVLPGESLAIVGASGCGKTTLMKLLLGLLTPTSGTISVGGRDIRALGLQNFRRMVGAVMQDDRLFAGSIAENIAFGEEDIDLARVESAARLAAIHDEVAAMPMGYHSLIGDMGTSLSGGQKQRLILARALYRRPRMLMLDEATSHLDVQRERLVNDAVRELALTKVIIAHRRETIASADRVLMLKEGRLVDWVKPHVAPAPMAVEA